MIDSRCRSSRGRSKGRRSWAGRSWAGIAGTMVDSSSPRNWTFAAGWRGHRGWVLRIAAALLDVDAVGGGWIGRGGPIGRDAAADAFWQVGRPAAIAVHEGRSIVRVATPASGSEVLVVVSALARSPGPFPIQLAARPASSASRPELADDGPQRSPAPTARRQRRPGSSTQSRRRGLPPGERTFHMLVRDGDAADREQLHGRARRAQGGRPRGPGLCRAGRRREGVQRA